jgi:zinc transporter 2
MNKLMLVTSVSVLFIGAELYGGYKSGSIAIFTDAAHLSADIFGFGFSIIALKISQKSSNESLSYGWHRSEIIGTMFSVATMWIMTLWLLVEATNRFFEPPKVTGWIMLLVACIGLVFNLIQIKILHTGDGHYHLGGDHHGHDHDHGHGHSHGHSHNHDDHNHDNHGQ